MDSSNVDEVIDSLLQPNTAITTTNEDEENYLHLACSTNNLPLLRLLLQHSKITDSLINQRNSLTGDTPLHLAVKNKCTAQIKLLLDRGADPNLTNYQRSSAFHESFHSRNNEIVYLFLDYPVSLSQVNKYGYNALHLAVSECTYDVLQSLLDTQTFDVNDLTLLYHQTPLHLLLWKNENHEVMVLAMTRLLVSRGADIRAIDKRNETPYYYAVSSKNLKVVKYLASLGVDVGRAENRGSIIAAAVRNGDIQMIEYLVGQGVEVDASNDKCDGLLHVAIKCIKDDELRLGVVECLLSKGVEIDDGDEAAREHTLLQLAMRQDDARLFDFLLERGASASAANGKGESALYTAVTCYNFEAAKTLIGLGCSLSYAIDGEEASVLPLVVAYRNLQVVELLLERGADPGNRRALITAASRGYVDVLRKMVQFGAKIENPTMYDLLVAAIQKQRLGVVEYLLSIGADVNYKPADNLLPLEHASQRHDGDNHEKIVCALVKEVAYLLFFEKHVHEGNTRMIEFRPWRAEYYSLCQRELEAMRRTVVCDSSGLTYRDVLAKCARGCVKFLRNDRLRETLEAAGGGCEFEIYGGKVRFACSRALERLRKVERFKALLARTVGLILRNDDVIEKICEYYDDVAHAECLSC